MQSKIDHSVRTVTLLLLFAGLPLIAQDIPGKVVEVADYHASPSLIRHLPHARSILAMLMLPNKDQVVVYNTAAESTEEKLIEEDVHIAIRRANATVWQLRMNDIAPVGGPTFYSFALLPSPPDHTELVFASGLGMNQAGKWFLFVSSTDTGYKVTATLRGSHSQLRFSEGDRRTFEFWNEYTKADTIPDHWCSQCPGLYEKNIYQRTGSKPQRASRFRFVHRLKYNGFDDHPLLMKKTE